MTAAFAATATRIGRAWPDALRMLAAALAAYGVSAALGLPDGYWAVLTALVVSRPSAGGLMRAGADRLAATVAGAALATALATTRLWHVPEPVLIAAALAPLSLLVAWDERFRAAPIAAIIVLSGGTALGSPVAVALARVAEVLLGAAIGIAASAIILPRQRAGRRHEEAGALLADLARLLRLLLGPQEDAAAAPLQAAIRRRLRALAVAGLGEPSRRRREADAATVPLLTRLSSDIAVLGRGWRALDPDARLRASAAADGLAKATELAARAIVSRSGGPWQAAFDEAAGRFGAACHGDADAPAAAALPFLLANLRADLDALAHVLGRREATATSAARRRPSRP